MYRVTALCCPEESRTPEARCPGNTAMCRSAPTTLQTPRLCSVPVARSPAASHCRSQGWRSHEADSSSGRNELKGRKQIHRAKSKKQSLMAQARSPASPAEPHANYTIRHSTTTKGPEIFTDNFQLMCASKVVEIASTCLIILANYPRHCIVLATVTAVELDTAKCWPLLQLLHQTCV